MLVLVFGCAKEQNNIINFTSNTESADINSVTLDLTVDIDGRVEPSQSGILYSLSPDPQVEDLKSYYTVNPEDMHLYGEVFQITEITKATTLQFNIGDLNDNTLYYYKPYVVVNGKLYLGVQDSFHTAVPTTLATGPAGGYVIYDDGSGGGIEMAPYDLTFIDNQNGYEDLSWWYEWGCFSTSIPGTSSALGSGANNSALILSGCGSDNIAARACSEYSYGGFSDWYLPSKDEIILMDSLIQDKGYGSISKTYDYWTSTEYTSTNAYGYSFSEETFSAFSKHSTLRVRPVRSF